MVKKEEEELEIIEKAEDNKVFDNPFEVLSALPKIHSNMRGHVTEDYTLAHLREADENFIRENYGNAWFCKMIVERYAEKGKRAVWNEKEQKWEMNEDGSIAWKMLSDDEKARIRKMAQDLFDNFMNQAHVIAILRRNKEANFLVKLLGKAPEEIEKRMNEVDEKSILDKIKDKLGGGDEDEGED